MRPPIPKPTAPLTKNQPNAPPPTPLADGVRPGAEQPDGEQQAQAIGGGAAKMQRRAPRAHGVAGEEQGGEESANHRLYDGRAV